MWYLYANGMCRKLDAARRRLPDASIIVTMSGFITCFALVPAARARRLRRKGRRRRRRTAATKRLLI